METNLTIWSDKDQLSTIRKAYASGLDENEFKMFIEIGRSLNANPFTREIYATKFGNKTNIFCGRDFYRKKAQEQSNYLGHFVDSVYSNDNFSVKNGEVDHGYNLKNRGELIGAYCTVYKKGLIIPFYSFVKFEEYIQKNSPIWISKPETMIKKVAESQSLRGAFQGIFEGTYDESEDWNDSTEKEIKSAVKKDKVQTEKIITEKAVDVVVESIQEPEKVIKPKGVTKEILLAGAAKKPDRFELDGKFWSAVAEVLVDVPEELHAEEINILLKSVNKKVIESDGKSFLMNIPPVATK